MGLTAQFVLSFTTTSDNDILAGTYFGGGVFRSSDNGASWSEQNHGLVATEIRVVAVNADNDIFAGTYGIGMFRSTDNGMNWEKVNNGLSGLYLSSLAISPSGDIFAGADFIDGKGGVFRSTDNGESWVEVNQGTIMTDVRALAINPSGEIFAGTYFGGGVFRSSDNGESWTAIDSGLGCTNIWSLAINSAGDIFAGTAGCSTGVYRSTDNGDHWTLANSGLTSTDIAGLAIKPNGYIFAATHSQFGVGGGIFRSVDNGDTWTEQNTGLTAIDINSLAVNSAGDLFAGALGGSFRSTDDGDTWSDISGGLIPAGGNVWTVAVDQLGYALAGTGGGGVFRSLTSTTGAPCPQTRRYWKDNPTIWPVDTLILGSQTYTRSELQRIVERDGPRGDASLVMARQLVAAKLNVANGSDPGPISSTIEDADALLSTFDGKLPYSVDRDSTTGQAMESDMYILVDYNHGNLTSGCSP
jgi:photosystem II stability/assembly factor-like uncharacterized protein